VIGSAPLGFRAPHFGLLQKLKHLEMMHVACRELGYKFSTSTIPSAAIQHGVAWKVNGVIEMPVSGSCAEPLKILDSWSHIVSPYQPAIQDSYGENFMKTIDFLQAHHIAGVLNYYVDPAHVSGSEIFLGAVAYATRQGIASLHYDNLLEMLG
jgi:hypothetical protein